MSRTTSADGIALIKQFEGCRLTAYKAVSTEKYYTIGYGHYGSDVTKSMTITQAQAEALLKEDLKIYEKAVNDLVKVDITQNMFDALVSFTYNCGSGALKTSTLLKKLNSKDYLGAAEEFLKWNKSGGTVLSGLINRREKEKALFLKDYCTLTVPLGPITPDSEANDIKWLQIQLNKANPNYQVEVNGKFTQATRISLLMFADSKGWDWSNATGYVAKSNTIKSLNKY